jgi:hypothetical protein
MATSIIVASVTAFWGLIVWRVAGLLLAGISAWPILCGAKGGMVEGKIGRGGGGRYYKLPQNFARVLPGFSQSGCGQNS